MYKMKKTSCAIIIYSYESFQFLKTCIRQARKFKHPDIEQRIIVSEQSKNVNEYNRVVAEFGNDSDVTIVHMKALFSGYSIDYILRYVPIESEFVCTMDVDAFAISPSWLSMPITLLQEDNFSFTGGLACHAEGSETIYPPSPFYWMSQFFTVGRLRDFMNLSLNGGFTKFHQRPNIDVPMQFLNNDWADWAGHVDGENYWHRGSDDGTVAHFWADKYTNNNKLALSISHIIGSPTDGSSYGRILDGLVFHFGYCYTSIGVEEHMGKNFNSWKAKINEDFNDEVVNDLVNLALQSPCEVLSRSIWDGKLKKGIPLTKELTEKIEKLKCGY